MWIFDESRVADAPVSPRLGLQSCLRVLQDVILTCVKFNHKDAQEALAYLILWSAYVQICLIKHKKADRYAVRHEKIRVLRF